MLQYITTSYLTDSITADQFIDCLYKTSYDYEQRGKRMAPKRRAISRTKAGGKKVKEEPEAPPKDKFTSAKEALKATGSRVRATRNPDSFCHLSNAEVRPNKWLNNNWSCLNYHWCLWFRENCEFSCKLLLALNHRKKILCDPNQQVHEDYDCMLNQTNIGNNNNKFYVTQVLVSGGKYYCWTRWGRVVSCFLFFCPSNMSQHNVHKCSS